VETFLKIPPQLGNEFRQILSTGRREQVYKRLDETGTIEGDGTTKGHAMLRAALGVRSPGPMLSSLRTNRATGPFEMTGHFPDVDFIIREDIATSGEIARSLTIETKVFIEEDDDIDAWDELKAALADIGADGLRRSYELLYALTKDDLDKDGPAHAVVQAAFKQIGIDGDKVP
jgi:hypothetical protein